MPGLHEQEDRAIDDALNALRFLQREEDRYDENQRRLALETAARKLKSIGQKIKELEMYAELFGDIHTVLEKLTQKDKRFGKSSTRGV